MKIKNITGSLMVLLFSIPALAQWNTNSNDIYYNSGNVGIGVSNPLTKLEVNGAAKYGSNAYVSGADNINVAHLATNAWHSGGNWNFSGFGGIFQIGIDGEFNFYRHQNSFESLDKRMALDDGGLKVFGGRNIGLVASSGTTDIGDLIFATSTEIQYGRIWTESSSSVKRLYLSSDDQIADITINEGGNVGIGTLSPSQKLEVNGTAKATAFQGNGTLLTGLNANNISSGVLGEQYVFNGQFMISSSGLDGQVWTSDGQGRGSWETPVAGGSDNMGDHTATQNITLGNFWLSGDGNNEGLTVDNYGNVGIGISAPVERLELDGAIRIGSTGRTNAGSIRWTGTDFEGYTGSEWKSFTSGTGGASSPWTSTGNTIYATNTNGRIGIGTTVPDNNAQLHVSGDGSYQLVLESQSSNPDITFKVGGIVRSQIKFDRIEDGLAFVHGDPATEYATMFMTGGKVGIGTTAPEHALDVAGTIRACRVEVNNVSNWCDYVFEPDYELPSLEEVESYIQTHKHLKDIPSEAEVMANGVSLDDMTKGLLKKVEENTLYIIQKDKENKALKKKMEQYQDLENQVEALLKRIEELENK